MAGMKVRVTGVDGYIGPFSAQGIWNRAWTSSELDRGLWELATLGVHNAG